MMYSVHIVAISTATVSFGIDRTFAETFVSLNWTEQYIIKYMDISMTSLPFNIPIGINEETTHPKIQNFQLAWLFNTVIPITRLLQEVFTVVRLEFWCTLWCIYPRWFTTHLVYDIYSIHIRLVQSTWCILRI